MAERCSEPLHPERLKSLMVIVPAASGDVALSTTLIRHVKRINPNCRVTFATRKANISLIRLCPGVDEIVELAFVPRLPGGHDWNQWSRRQELADHAGKADDVVCVISFPEDVDLLERHGLNILESIWLLAGVTGGMPPEPQRVWLEAPTGGNIAADTVERSLTTRAQISLAARSVTRLTQGAASLKRFGTLRGSGIKQYFGDLQSLSNLGEIRRARQRHCLATTFLAEQFVILSTEATSLPPPPDSVVRALVAMLRGAGRTVLHNVRDPLRAAPGTVPLVCGYPEFVALREAGVPFVGWRSGLCDIAAASTVPMCVLNPPKNEIGLDMIEAFGLASMNAAANCLDIVCEDVDDLNQNEILNHIQGNTYDGSL